MVVTDRDRQLAELTSDAATLAYGIEHLHFRGPDEYDDLRVLTESFLAKIGLETVELPQTREAFRSDRPQIIHLVGERLQERQAELNDSAPFALFRIVLFATEAAARIALDVSPEGEVRELQHGLRDLGVDPLLTDVLERDAGAVPLDGERNIRLSNLWLVVRTFVGRVTDEWTATDDFRSKGPHAVNLFIEQLDNLGIERVDMVKQEKVITISNSTVNAPVTVADSIESSFNTIQQSAMNDDLKKLLEELARAVADAARSAPDDVARTMGRDVETLTNELSSEEPRRAWWELSLTSLRDASVKIGEIAAPILVITAKIAALL